MWTSYFKHHWSLLSIHNTDARHTLRQPTGVLRQQNKKVAKFLGFSRGTNKSLSKEITNFVDKISAYISDNWLLIHHQSKWLNIFTTWKIIKYNKYFYNIVKLFFSSWLQIILLLKLTNKINKKLAVEVEGSRLVDLYLGMSVLV